MSRRSFDWYLTITLAGLTALVICLALSFDVWTLVEGDETMRRPPANPGIFFFIAVLVPVISVFWFWIRMLNDYFRNRPQKNPVAWGWALFLLNVWAALAYCWFVWRPRNNGV